MTIRQLMKYAEQHNISLDNEVEVLGYSFDQVAGMGIKRKKDRVVLIPVKSLDNLLFSGISNIQKEM